MKKLLQRSLSLVLSLMLILSMPMQVLADEWYLDEGDITITAPGNEGESQNVSQGTVNKADNAPVISQSRPSTPAPAPAPQPATPAPTTPPAEGTVNNNVTIQGNGDVNVTIKGDTGEGSKDVNVNVSGNVTANGDGGIKVESGNVNVDVNGSITAGDNATGVEVQGGNVDIDIKQDGSINASGDNSTGVDVQGGSADVNIGGDINVDGDNSTGVNAGSGSDVTIHDGASGEEIVVTGSNSTGVAANGDSSVELDGADIVVGSETNNTTTDSSGVSVNGNSNVSTSGTNTSYNTVYGENSTGYDINGNGANVSINNAQITASGNGSSAMDITSDKATVSIANSTLTAEKDDAVAIVGKSADSQVDLNLNNANITSLGGSGIDLSSFFINHFKVTGQTNAKGNIVSVKNKTYIFEPVLDDGSVTLADVYLQDLEGFVDEEYLGGAFIDENGLLGEYYYRIAIKDIDDYYDKDGAGNDGKYIYVRQDAAGQLFIKYPVANPNYREGNGLPKYIAKTVYLEAVENELDVTMTLEGNNTVTSTDDVKDTDNPHTIAGNYHAQGNGEDSADGKEGYDELGNEHAAIHVTEDDLTITTEEDKTGTLNAVATDPHIASYTHYHKVYSNGTWTQVPVTHTYKTDLQTGAAIGTNGTYTSKGEWTFSEHDDQNESTYYCPSFDETEGEFVYQEELTGSITITGNATVNASTGESEYGNLKGFDGAAIGTGYGSSMAESGEINITGNATVNASGKNGAAIGTGQELVADTDTTDVKEEGSADLKGTINVGGNAEVHVSSNHGAAIGTGKGGDLYGEINIGENAQILGYHTYADQGFTAENVTKVYQDAYLHYQVAYAASTTFTYYDTNGVPEYQAGEDQFIGYKCLGCDQAVIATYPGTHIHNEVINITGNDTNFPERYGYLAASSGASIPGLVGSENPEYYTTSVNTQDHTKDADDYAYYDQDFANLNTEIISGEGYVNRDQWYVNYGITETEIETTVGAYADRGNSIISEKAYSNDGAAIGTGVGGHAMAGSAITIGGTSTVQAQSNSGAAIGTGVGGNLSGEINVKDNAQLVNTTKYDLPAGTKDITYRYQAAGADTATRSDDVWEELTVEAIPGDATEEECVALFNAAYKTANDIPEDDTDTVIPSPTKIKEVLTQEGVTSQDAVGLVSGMGAAIGTGMDGKITSDGSINISGGKVVANGGAGAAAIGTGSSSIMARNGDVEGTITISGNAELAKDTETTKAVTTKTYNNSGKLVKDTKDETITTVREIGVIGGANAAGIGAGGWGQLSGTINVFDNALVLAQAGQNGAAIGTGYGTASTAANHVSGSASITETGSIDILGGRIERYTEVITNLYNNRQLDETKEDNYRLAKTDREEIDLKSGAVGSTTGAAIGTGYWGKMDGNIVIQDSTVNAQAGTYGAGIGSGDDGRVAGNITIYHSDVTATSTYGAAIGSGDDGNTKTEELNPDTAFTGTITITSSKVNATSKGNGAAIGTGSLNEMLGDIIISGNADVVAISANGAAIGTGYGATTHIKTAKESEVGPLVLVEGTESTDFTDVYGNNYHELTAEELAELKQAILDWEEDKKEWEADPENAGKEYPVESPERTRYAKKIPTIQILNKANVETYTNPEKTDDVDTYGVIGVATPGQPLVPVTEDFEHMYVLSTAANINGRKSADNNWLLEFMNLTGNNLVWVTDPTAPLPGVAYAEDEELARALYWVTEVDDLSILMDHEDETNNGELTVVAEKEDAAFVTYYYGLNELSKMGVKTIVFKSGDTESRFDVADALDELAGGHLVVYHDNGETRMTLGGQDCDLLK